MLRKLFLIESLIGSIVLTVLLVINFGLIYLLILIPSWIIMYFTLVALFIGFAFVTSLFYSKKKEYTKQSFFTRNLLLFTMEGICDFAGIRVKCSGLEKVPHDKRYLMVYNHISSFDPLITAPIFRKDKLIHITKMENLNIPICGPYIHRNLYISLDRNNNKDALKKILKACNYVKNQEYSIGVSPEGTRNKEDVFKLLPFREGCFNVAVRGKCPIVITELYNFDKAKKNFPFKRTKCEINVLRVLEYDEFKDLSTIEIAELVRNEIQKKLDSRLENKQ